jgi:hypothetical protein
MSFLLAEDEAVRNLLLGMTVTDQKSVTEEGSTRNVGVWFGQPDQELTEQKYPYITIDMVDIAEDFSRAMRGKVKPTYYADPSVMVQGAQGVQQVNYDDDVHNWDMDFPIPVNIDYQLTTYSRQPRHDRQLLAQLLYTKIPLRFAILNTGANTALGTTRRLDVLDIAKRDVSENGKRLFVNAITVRVSSEIAQSTFNKLYKALELNITGVSDTESNQNSRGPFTMIDPITITAP